MTRADPHTGPDADTHADTGTEADSGADPRGGVPRRAGVAGSPIGHSLSPALHRAAYRELGLDWRYEAYDVDVEALPGFLASLDPSWAGLSLTMPLKRSVLTLLDEVSPLAAAVEAVNTVVFAAGRRRGENTDVPGMVAALAERGVHQVGSAAVLGGGATASSAIAALRGLCTGPVTVYARGPGRAAELHRLAECLGQPVTVAPWDGAAAGLRAELVVSTTPAGAADALVPAVPGGQRGGPQPGGPGQDSRADGRRPGVLFDVVYHPWPTPLAAAWDAAGGTVVSGLDLLVHQAVLQVEAMTGVCPGPLAAMRAAGERVLAERV